MYLILIYNPVWYGVVWWLVVRSGIGENKITLPFLARFLKLFRLWWMVGGLIGYA